MNAICIIDPNCSTNSQSIKGEIKFYQSGKFSPTKVAINLQGLKPNSTNAIHIHEYGNTKSCMDSGAHYNPFNQKHGYYKLDGDNRHAGDLINNINSDSQGNVIIEFTDDLVSLFGEYSVIGRSIVIHERPDDLGRGGNEESLRTGNAGGRMVCAVIGRDKLNPF